MIQQNRQTKTYLCIRAKRKFRVKIRAKFPLAVIP